jgi:putative FmdB family regulatory protein
MPTYRYRCSKCGEELEVWQSIKDSPLTRHDGDCGGELRTVMSPAGIVLKGKGFYRNDSRSKVKSEAGKSDGASKDTSSGDKPSKSDGSKSDGSKSEGSKSDSSKSDGSKSEGASKRETKTTTGSGSGSSRSS